MTDSRPASTHLTRLVTSDERDAAVSRLTGAFADDAIPVAEFERRVSEVWRVSTVGELVALTRDLPTGPTPETHSPASPVPTPSPASSALTPPPPTAPAAAPQRLKSIMSSVERRFHGPMPARLDVQATLGNVELDLRDAEFPPGVTEIRVKALMGNIEIELPPHVAVHDEGRAFMGSFVVRSPRRRSDPRTDAPVVRITGRSFLSSIEVEVDD